MFAIKETVPEKMYNTADNSWFDFRIDDDMSLLILTLRIVDIALCCTFHAAEKWDSLQFACPAVSEKLQGAESQGRNKTMRVDVDKVDTIKNKHLQWQKDQRLVFQIECE